MNIFKRLVSPSGNTIVHHNTSNSELITPAGQTVGTYRDGVVRDKLGNDRMYVQTNGVVLDHCGNPVGYVDSYGTVRDNAGNAICYEE